MLSSSGVADGWPKSLSDTVFHELPSDLDAALNWEESFQGPERTYFFKVSHLVLLLLPITWKAVQYNGNIGFAG